MMPPSLRELADRLREKMPRTAALAESGEPGAESCLRVAHARLLGMERAAADAAGGGDPTDLDPAELLTMEIGVAGMTRLIDCAPAPYWLDAYDRGYSDETTRLNHQENPK